MEPGRWPAGLPTVLRLEKANRTALPAAFACDDVRFSEGLVAELVRRLTEPGDVVFDPFAGFGTTLVAAEELGREGWGIELDPARAAYARSRLAEPQRLIEGDARELRRFAVPPVSLALCSPPYSTPGEDLAALTAYRDPNPGYRAYLDGIGDVFRNLGTLLLPGGWVVIEVSNLRTDRGLTLLAWDIARAVGEVLPFAGELVVHWQPTYNYGYDHSYCLVFSAPEIIKAPPGV
jgi:SAM-dependent methyltransferase